MDFLWDFRRIWQKRALCLVLGWIVLGGSCVLFLRFLVFQVIFQGFFKCFLVSKVIFLDCVLFGAFLFCSLTSFGKFSFFAKVFG